jgi:hypothetical protein
MDEAKRPGRICCSPRREGSCSRWDHLSSWRSDRCTADGQNVHLLGEAGVTALYGELLRASAARHQRNRSLRWSASVKRWRGRRGGSRWGGRGSGSGRGSRRGLGRYGRRCRTPRSVSRCGRPRCGRPRSLLLRGRDLISSIVLLPSFVLLRVSGGAQTGELPAVALRNDPRGYDDLDGHQQGHEGQGQTQIRHVCPLQAGAYFIPGLYRY